MRNKTKMLDRTQVEGTRGGDKGREVNPGKQCKETEMVWRIDREDTMERK